MTLQRSSVRQLTSPYPVPVTNMKDVIFGPWSCSWPCLYRIGKVLEELFQCRLRESQRTDQSPNSWINNDGGDDDGNDGDDDDDGYSAYSHRDKIPPWWGNVSNDEGGNMSVSKIHHTPCWIIFWSIYICLTANLLWLNDEISNFAKNNPEFRFL